MIKAETSLEGMYEERKEERLRANNKQDERVNVWNSQCEHVSGEEERNTVLSFWSQPPGGVLD